MACSMESQGEHWISVLIFRQCWIYLSFEHRFILWHFRDIFLAFFRLFQKRACDTFTLGINGDVNDNSSI